MCWSTRAKETHKETCNRLQINQPINELINPCIFQQVHCDSKSTPVHKEHHETIQEGCPQESGPFTAPRQSAHTQGLGQQHKERLLKHHLTYAAWEIWNHTTAWDNLGPVVSNSLRLQMQCVFCLHNLALLTVEH